MAPFGWLSACCGQTPSMTAITEVPHPWGSACWGWASCVPGFGRSSASTSPAEMITQGERVESHALRGRGWSISAIARHIGVDRKTVRAHLAGQDLMAHTPAPVGCLMDSLMNAATHRTISRA